MKRHSIRRLLVFSMGFALLVDPGKRGVAPTERLSPAGAVTSGLPAVHGRTTVPELENRGLLFSSLREALQAARFRVYEEQHSRATWYAENPAQQIRARFSSDGVRVQAKSSDGQPHIDMNLVSVGYGERQIRVTTGRLAATDNRIEYRRSFLGDETAGEEVTESYVNSAAGLEQYFTLESAPGERRQGERLRLTLALKGELRAHTMDDGRALEFTNAAGQPTMRYDHLVVSDARGRELEARMSLGREGREVSLEVDDRSAVWPVTVDPTFTQQQKLVAPDAAADDRFGGRVAISGETLVVGARFDDGTGGTDQGAAYVFVRSGGAWSEQAKLEAPDAAPDDRFGVSVAISGETIVVGAPETDGPAGVDQGSAYVFVRSAGVWSLQQRLLAADGAQSDEFGVSVAIEEDTVVVGAMSDDGVAGIDQGSAYIFARSGDTWSQQQKLLASDAREVDFFGEFAAISAGTVVVGAHNANGTAGLAQGSAYVFVDSGGIWSEQQKLLPSDAEAGDSFGTSVAIDGETIVVGAVGDDGSAGHNQGSAYVFVRNSNIWSQQQKLLASDAGADDQFGASVAISSEAVVVGAPQDDASAGAAYIFVRSGDVWTQQQKLVASDAVAGDFFGSVAVSGETVVVGAEFDDDRAGVDQGSVYVFASAPTITLKSPISLWPPNHMYQTVTMSQMALSATDAEDGNLIDAVRIEKVTSDEPDDVPGSSDGNTSNDIVIAGTCTSVALRAERDDTKNGRVYSVTLRVADSAGNLTRAMFKITVPRDMIGFPATEDAPALTVSGRCQ